MSDEKVIATKAKVQRLLDTGFICDVRYPSWLANVVMVKKKNDKWRMRTDFTNLNKCCPKDDFLLARIDKVVDSAAGCEVMALLDYFLGYHQIWLRKEDEERTSFIKPFSTYCYLRMPEGLKNAGPTFYRMKKAILKEQMERNVFAYIDDIVVASMKKETQLQDIAETFANMQKAQVKLNLEKCVFGVSRGKVLGLVSVKGIEANQDKINAIVHMKLLGSRKEVQKLIGRIAALNRFMAKITERSLPIFKALRGSDTFEWRPEQQQAFDALKEYIQKLPTLASPQPDQPHILYVSGTHTVVSRALIQERERERERERDWKGTRNDRTKSLYISFSKLRQAQKSITRKWKRYVML
jgi:hypothetical protein